jgi:ATP-dependent DNA ligase
MTASYRHVLSGEQITPSHLKAFQATLLAHRRHQVLRIGKGGRQRLVADDVDPGLEKGLADRVVQDVRRDDADDIDPILYAFDLLNQNGELLANLPFSRRGELLENLLAVAKDPLRLSPLLQAPSREVLEAVHKLGLEGVVGKRIDSIYEPGERSGAWIKHRTNREQEFVIGGYIPGAHGFDGLLVGVYENNSSSLRR